MLKVSISVTGIPEAQKILALLTDQRVLTVATGEVLLAVKERAKAESSGPARWVGGVNHPRKGGPGIVTGEHRASIQVEGPMPTGRTSLRGYVSATSGHSLFLERGTKRMPAYPFLAPAAKAVAPRAGDIFLRHWLRAVAGG
jgi:hypothetical protein